MDSGPRTVKGFKENNVLSHPFLGHSLYKDIVILVSKAGLKSEVVNAFKLLKNENRYALLFDINESLKNLKNKGQDVSRGTILFSRKNFS